MEINSVWTIEEIAVSEHTLGIYSTRAQAVLVQEKIKRGVVKQRMLNPGINPGDYKYWITIDRDGTNVRVGRDDRCTELDVTYEINPASNKPAYMLARVWAPDTCAATLIADAHRLHLIATGEWND